MNTLLSSVSLRCMVIVPGWLASFTLFAGWGWLAARMVDIVILQNIMFLCVLAG